MYTDLHRTVIFDLIHVDPDPFLTVFSSHQQETMSETAKDKGAVSTKEKGGAEKRGRGRPRKNPQVWRRTSGVPVC